jgi:hypothetical protein
MVDVDVHFVMAMFAFAGARTRHQLGLRSRRLELNYLAQVPFSSLDKSLRLAFAACAGQSPKPHRRKPYEAFRIGLIVSASFLEARDFRIVERIG